MQIIKSGLVIISVFVFLIISCNMRPGQEKRQTNHTSGIDNIKLDLTKAPGDFRLGDTLFFLIKIHDGGKQPDSVRIYHNNEFQYSVILSSASSDTLCFVVPGHVGANTIQTRVRYDNVVENDAITAYFKSDIVPKQYQYKIINEYPHDLKAFTQGLFYRKGYLYESTGLWGQSSLRKVEIESGKVVQKINLENQYFAEGITLFDDKIIQLTYKSGVAFVYDMETFEKVDSFHYPNAEGWGITTYRDQLIMSDGSNKLFFWNQSDFVTSHVADVYDYNGPVTRINELEYISGKIFANIFLEDRILVIDPETGRVKAQIDFSDLLQAQDKHPNIDVLNGIAFNKETGNLYITGKNWSKLYEVKLIDFNTSF